MKTNIKLRVTPEQSEAVQNICFANGVFWYAGNGSEVRYTKAEYLFIESNRIWFSVITDHNIGTETEGYTEVDADLFIKTNGTCEEFTCEHPGVNNTTGKCITCGEHIDKSDFEPNIQSSALSSEQLKLFRAGRNFEIPQYLSNNPTKLLKELNSELMKATKTTSINLKPDYNEIKLNEQGKSKIITCDTQPLEVDAERLLVKAFGKEYILEPEEIEAIKKSETAYPSSKLPKLKPYSKISSQKAECQFEKYGFEKPDFDCELWQVETSTSFEYVHGLVLNDYAHPMGNLTYHKWNKKTGEVLVGCSSKNLTPIKKPWYETCKFPCLVKYEDDIFPIYEKEGYSEKYLATLIPLTNDEIEGLKQ